MMPKQSATIAIPNATSTSRIDLSGAASQRRPSTLNGFPPFVRPVFTGEPTVRVTTDGLVSTTVALRLHLQSSHFAGVQMAGGGGSGTLLLRCTATVATLYDRYAELELGVPQRDPVPARVL
ncbi:conserved hypothetical protein [Culex quinquefasciatus]|uniref:Uncharacterized protein n=1 Tax=Culex quinquefasciatus TaxID=7176 RepID=B0WKG0_CULQU|nr:conserved hypothetical protein [Culex quinquefasciatus]|eukprot:XP_001849194.1 conserved hypothetical protein [Culex quinquefasciatus]